MTTEAKHTPGPWVAKNIAGAGWQIHGNPGAFDWGVYRWDGREPLLLYQLRKESPQCGFADERWMQFPQPEWDAMQAANAQLIAAAPELRDKLVALIAEVETALLMMKCGQAEKAETNLVRAVDDAKQTGGGCKG